MAAIRRLRAVQQGSNEELCRQIIDRVIGLDLNPLAVATARANYLLAIADLLPDVEGLEIPVYLCDSILDGPEATGHPQRPFDYVVGNPPWIAWDNLPDDYRAATKPLGSITACFRFRPIRPGTAERRRTSPCSCSTPLPTAI